MADTEIPQGSRDLVTARQAGRCLRCSGAGTDWHHRRSRRVRGEHRHCPCNGVLLCRDCHSWAHAHPLLAQAQGLVVSQWVDRPGEVPVTGLWDRYTLDCEGGLKIWRPDQAMGQVKQ